ncbi:hypothetical protein Patl1_24295 [Pistacia atlantica]|uniref:Uncharacterized protein n=1 Tax=Pistacia atlantica TaxID=434234 RepID=A0ACC0ZYL5_9ROSI|nr:hypothetical protein Patl1_24295 [Pistacia atlantica]
MGIDSDVFVANSLIDMYAKSGHPSEASCVFHYMPVKNVVTWNAMIANFTQNGLQLAALELVRAMPVHNKIPNSVTLTNVLPACARVGFLRPGKEIHAVTIRMGFNFDLFVTNTLTDMYAKCGCLDLAQSVFDISLRDEISYNILIASYAETSDCSKSLSLFSEMGLIGMMHDVVSFVGAISACANLAAIKQGKEIHGVVMRNLFHAHLFVANSLLGFYSRCGRIDIADKIFERIPNKDAASWNTMILGYGMLGEFPEILGIVSKMANRAEINSKLAKLGLSAVLASGLFDGVTYTSFFLLAFLGYERSTGKNPATILKALLGGNNITRPFRVSGAAALAPFIEKGIRYLRAATVFLSLFILPELSFAAPNPSGFRLRLIPRDYPGSPLNPGNLTELERERFINYFNGRGTRGRLHSNTANSSSFNDRKFVTPLYRDTFYYIGEFSIGSEPANVTVYLVIDTTSSLIWMQCQPCKNCYHQQLPMYNSQASKSYSKVSCEDPYCSKSSGFECVNDECVYKAHYDEGGSTNGILSRESFTFQTDNKGGNLTVPGVVFGCSSDNQNFPQFERDGIISGVMGLSFSPESLFGQLSNVMQNVFSYCIVPFSPMLQHPSILRFGEDVHIPNRPISTVRYYIMEENYNYYLTLTDISVGESRIGFPPEIFLPNNSGIFIDPGTPITQLVADSTDRHPNVLHYVLLEFQAYFDSFGLVEVNGTGLGFDLCYNQTADFKQYPTMTYHFSEGL